MKEFYKINTYEKNYNLFKSAFAMAVEAHFQDLMYEYQMELRNFETKISTAFKHFQTKITVYYFNFGKSKGVEDWKKEIQDYLQNKNIVEPQKPSIFQSITYVANLEVDGRRIFTDEECDEYLQQLHLNEAGNAGEASHCSGFARHI